MGGLYVTEPLGLAGSMRLEYATEIPVLEAPPALNIELKGERHAFCHVHGREEGERRIFCRPDGKEDQGRRFYCRLLIIKLT